MNMNGSGSLEHTPPGVKRKREDSADIPRPFLRGGEDAVWRGAGTGANAVVVKMVKMESP
jgi:hypothetical protein